jgi:site-specific DNA recombinase
VPPIHGRYLLGSPRSSLILATSKGGTHRYRYYTCSSALKKGWRTCSSKSIPAAQIEEFVLGQKVAVTFRPSGIKTLAEELAGRSEEAVA